MIAPHATLEEARVDWPGALWMPGPPPRIGMRVKSARTSAWAGGTVVRWEERETEPCRPADDECP